MMNVNIFFFKQKTAYYMRISDWSSYVCSSALVNTLAPMRMVERFAGLIEKSAHKTVINISSRMGSIGENTSGGDYIYRSSKAALNMVTKSLAIDLAGRGITVISAEIGRAHV